MFPAGRTKDNPYRGGSHSGSGVNMRGTEKEVKAVLRGLLNTVRAWVQQLEQITATLLPNGTDGQPIKPGVAISVAADPLIAYPALMNFGQVCEATGYHRRTIERMVSAGQFPDPVQPGGEGTAVKFRRVDVARWIGSGGKRVRQLRAKKAAKSESSE